MSRRRSPILEAFLQRTLPPKIFKKIRWYEMCVAVNHSTRPMIVYLIVTTSLLLLTEFPHPKTVRLFLEMSKISQIKVGYGVPVFLAEPYRSRSYQIEILYQERKILQSLRVPAILRILHQWKERRNKINSDPNENLDTRCTASLYVLNEESMLFQILKETYENYCK